MVKRVQGSWFNSYLHKKINKNNLPLKTKNNSVETKQLCSAPHCCLTLIYFFSQIECGYLVQVGLAFGCFLIVFCFILFLVLDIKPRALTMFSQVPHRLVSK